MSESPLPRHASHSSLLVIMSGCVLASLLRAEPPQQLAPSPVGLCDQTTGRCLLVAPPSTDAPRVRELESAVLAVDAALDACLATGLKKANTEFVAEIAIGAEGHARLAHVTPAGALTRQGHACLASGVALMTVPSAQVGDATTFTLTLPLSLVSLATEDHDVKDPARGAGVGVPSRPEILIEVHSHFDDFRRCIPVGTTLTVAWQFLPAGTAVFDATAPIADAATVTCLRRVVSDLRLPAFVGKPLPVRVPFQGASLAPRVPAGQP